MPHQPQAGERPLFKTRNSEQDWENATFMTDLVSFSVSAA
jgi:hypothetical protein